MLYQHSLRILGLVTRTMGRSLAALFRFYVPIEKKMLYLDL